jgi:hypothetical protein
LTPRREAGHNIDLFMTLSALSIVAHHFGIALTGDQQVGVTV